MKKNDSSGNIDTVIMITLVIISITATMSILSQPNRVKYAFNVHNSMKVIKQNLFLHMDNSIGWQYTLAKNSSMGCLLNHTDCSTYDGVKTPVLQIQNVGDDDYLTNLGSPSRGVGLDGVGCDTFDAVNGNARCPIKIDITWRPTCVGAPCVDPSYQVEVKFSYSVPSGYGMKMNLSKYDFLLAK